MFNKKFSTLVKHSVPSFVLEEYPMFVEFMEAYYEFKEQFKGPTNVLKTIPENEDIDTTSLGSKIFTLGSGTGTFEVGEIVYQGATIGDAFGKGIVHEYDVDNSILEVKEIIGSFNTDFGDIKGITSSSTYDVLSIDAIDTSLNDFITWFKKEIIPSVPQEILTDPKNFIKNARHFYKAKGTQKSYKLLFRILFNENVDFYYPWRDMLRPDDGKWILPVSLKVFSNVGDPFKLIGKTVRGEQSGATGFVEDVQFIQYGIYSVYEVFLTNDSITGEFIVNEFLVSDIAVVTKIIPVLSKFTITDSGDSYVESDIITFISPTGTGAKAKITSVSDIFGQIINAEIIDFGINYTPNESPTVIFPPTTGNIASGVAEIGTLCRYPGYFLNEDGMLNTEKYLQDDYYYQQFSYVVIANRSLEQYKDIVLKLLHPAGLILFGIFRGETLLESPMTLDSGIGTENAFITIMRQQFLSPVTYPSETQPLVLDMTSELPDTETQPGRIQIRAESTSTYLQAGPSVLSFDLEHEFQKPVFANFENVFLSVDDLTIAPWAFTNSTIALSAVKSYNDLRLKVYQLTETTGNGQHLIQQEVPFCEEDMMYRFSFMVKRNAGTPNVRLELDGTAITTASGATIDLSNGSVLAQNGLAKVEVETFDTWYKVSICKLLDVFGNVRAKAMMTSGITLSYVGSVSNSILISEVQLNNASMSYNFTGDFN